LSAALLLACTAVGCSDSLPVIHPSDPAAWMEVELKELPVAVEFPVGEPSDKTYPIWSPDGSKIAWLSKREQGDTLSWYTFGSGEQHDIALDARAKTLTVDWRADSQRIMVGTFTKPTVPRGMSDLVRVEVDADVRTPGDLLRAYDTATGALAWQMDYRVLGGGIGQAQYSNHGDRLMVELRPMPRMNVGTAVAAYRAVIRESDGTLTPVRNGMGMPTWRHDDAGYLDSVDKHDYPWWVHQSDWLEWMLPDVDASVLTYTPFTGNKGATVLFGEPDFYFNFTTYPDDGGIVRYDWELEHEGNGNTLESQIREYRFADASNHILLDLHALFLSRFDDPAAWTNVSYADNTANRFMVTVTTAMREDAHWYVSLAPKRFLAKFPEDLSSWFMLSPDGSKAAHKTTDDTFRVLDVHAALIAAGVEVE
jgi:hypothetical protein